MSAVYFSLATPDGRRTYTEWFVANLAGLEEIVATLVPGLTRIEESDFRRFTGRYVEIRFDELVQPRYQEWQLDKGKLDGFGHILDETRHELITELGIAWSSGSEPLKAWCEEHLPIYERVGFDSRELRWQHRAHTDQIMRCCRSDANAQLENLIKELERLASEETRELLDERDSRRVQVWVFPTGHDIRSGYSGDYLERVRIVIEAVGKLLFPSAGTNALDHSLRLLLTELICENEPIDDPRLLRLDSQQRHRYCYTLEGNEVKGEIRRVCEALMWYCRRLSSLLETVANRRELESGQPTNNPSLNANNRLPQEIIDSFRIRSKVRSYEKLAGRIGISKDTLYAITKETRWLADQTYQLVATACNCEPEELHPRDLPRRKSV
jgi:hypothetical protein